MSDVIELPAPICPVLSGAQIIPYGFGLKGMANPVSQLDFAALKSGGALGGSGAFEVQLAGGYNYKGKKEEGKAPDPNNPPPPVGDPISVPCIGLSCAWWDGKKGQCRGPEGLATLVADLTEAAGEISKAFASKTKDAE